MSHGNGGGLATCGNIVPMTYDPIELDEARDKTFGVLVRMKTADGNKTVILNATVITAETVGVFTSLDDDQQAMIVGELMDTARKQAVTYKEVTPLAIDDDGIYTLNLTSGDDDE